MFEICCFFLFVFFCCFFQESTAYQVETGNKCLLLTYNVRFFIYITDVSLMREAVEAIIILIIKNIFFQTGERSGSTTLLSQVTDY